MRIVRCIIWRQWLGRGRLIIVKLRTCFSFSLLARVALLTCPRAYVFLALQRHEIRCPIENLDYLYIITTERTPRRPAVFRELANCLCLRCPDMGVTRLRTLGALVPYLRDA